MIKTNLLTSDYLLDNSLRQSAQLPLSGLLSPHLQQEVTSELTLELSTEQELDANIFTSDLLIKPYFPSEDSQSLKNTTLLSSFTQDEALFLSAPYTDDNIVLDSEAISLNLSAVAGDPNPSLDGVFGDDDRTRITNTTSDPWSKIGFVKTRFGNTWFGSSGVMIGPHHFLTSAHSIFDSTLTDSAGNGGYADEVKIYLGQDGQEKYYGEVGVTRFHTVNGYTGDKDGDGILADADDEGDYNSGNYDWAVLTLDRNIGSHTGWMGWQWNSDLSWYDGLDVNITGYPGDTINDDGTIINNWSGSFAGTDFSASMYNISGQLNSADNYQLKDNIDSTGGNSGGPVWRSEGNSEYVVGLVRATISNSEGTPIHNEELRLQKYITDFIEEWKTNDPNPVDRPDFVDYDEWFGTDFAYFRNNTTGGFRDDLSNSSLDVAVGDSITFSSVVRNNGTARVDNGLYFTEPRVNVSFYASFDTTINSADYKLGDVSISAIDPFKWSYATLNTAFPDIPEGNYHIGYTFGSITSEFDTTNNTGIIDGSTINVIHKKDLSGLSFNVVQEPLEVGDSFDVNFAIQNRENYTAGAFSVYFYLSDNSTITTGDRYLGSYSIGSLAGNTNTGNLSTRLILPGVSDTFWHGDGNYYIGMIVDGGGQVQETNEYNNRNTGELIDYDGVNITIPSNIQGTSGNDRLVGTANSDRIDGLDGKDVINGNGGNDSLYGGAGKDQLYGGDGLDELYGGEDNDKLYGENGNDYLVGEDGRDKIKGGLGDDVIFGGNDRDDLDGEDGNDVIYGDAGDDKLKGKNGADELFGGSGKDKLDGGDGDDLLMGGLDQDKLDGDRGNDQLFGGDGNDTLKGDHGDDQLVGGDGNDYLDGGSGADRFIFYSWNEGVDTIKGFDWQDGDRIEIATSGFGIGAKFSFDSNTGDIFFDGSDTINATAHIATLSKVPKGFDINQHLVLI